MERGAAGPAMTDELRSVLDALPGLVWTALPEGNVDFVNRRWCEYTGVPFDENSAAGGWQAAIHPEDLPGLLAEWVRVLPSGAPAEVQARMRRSDGQYRRFLIRATPIRDAAGRIIKWYGVNYDIEDRLSMPEEVRSVLDTLPGLVWTALPGGYVDYFNRRWCEYTGITLADNVEANGWQAAIHPEDLPGLLAEWMRVLPTGQTGEVEVRMRRFDGRYRRFLIRANPIRDATGHIVKWYGVNYDIEDQTRAEHALRARALDLRTLLDSCPVPVCVMSAAGELEGINRHVEEYFGRSLEQLKPWENDDSILPEDLPRTTAVWRDAWEKGHPYEIEHRYRRADGVYRWFHSSGLPLRDPEGRIVRWILVHTDIENRKQAETLLKQSEAFLAKAQTLSSTGSFSWHVTTQEFIWSQELYRLFEFDPALPVTIERVMSRVHPDDLASFQEMLRRAAGDFEYERDFEYELRLVMPDGAIKHVHLVANGTRDDEGQTVFIGAAQNITERRLSELALDRVRMELARVARVSSLGALTASIAHEVNQPLSGVVTNASTCLRMLGADPPNIEGALETTRRTIRDGNRAADVIARLRALFGKQGVSSEPMDLNDAARAVIALSSSELQRHRVIVRAELDQQLPPITGDRIQLQQVILNLLLNAMEAMNGITDRPRTLVIRTERDESDGVRLSVRDAGVGLDRVDPERLFEAFYTTKDGGMGIGLSVSRSIIERHRGRLWAAPNDGPGATFSFSIPHAPEVVAETRALPSPANDPGPIFRNL